MASSEKGRYANPPREWHFSVEARAQHADTFWRCPTTMFAEGGLGARMWRDEGTCRGGGTVPALLPALAMHTFPGKTIGAGNEGESATWTAWKHLSQRRLARLVGLSLGAVGAATSRLEAMRLLERRAVPPPPHFGGPPWKEYRLHASLYPQGSDHWTALPANLLYGGWWAMLPTSASKHLYLALACLDPVLNEERFQECLEAEDSEDSLSDIRARRCHSLAQLEERTGMSRSTVEAGLRVLVAPIPVDGGGEFSLVASGPALRAGMRWHAPDRRVRKLTWPPAALNDRSALEGQRKRLWPHLYASGRAAQAPKRSQMRAAR